MTTSETTRVRGRLSQLEYLIAANAKLSQAEAVLKQAVSVHGPAARLEGFAIDAVRTHLALALNGIAEMRRVRNPVHPQPVASQSPVLIRSGRVIFSCEESAHE